MLLDHSIDDWERAVKDLSAAEQRVLSWQLQGAGPVPMHYLERVQQQRDRVDLLFETASLVLSPLGLDSPTAEV